MENQKFTAEEIGRLLTTDEINQKLNLFFNEHKEILPKTVHETKEHLLTLDLVPVQNSTVDLPIAFRSNVTQSPDYYKQSWKHEVNNGFWLNGQRIKVACAMCDIYFGASVPQLYQCLKSSLDHSNNNKKPPFVFITDRAKNSFNGVPSGTVVVKTSKKYKETKIRLV